MYEKKVTIDLVGIPLVIGLAMLAKGKLKFGPRQVAGLIALSKCEAKLNWTWT